MEQSIGVIAGLALGVAGLAFFATGLAIALEACRPSRLRLTRGLWLLGAFAWLQSLACWSEALLSLQGQTRMGSALVLPIALTLFSSMSGFLLLQFSIQSVLAAAPGQPWLRWLPPALTAVWLLALGRAVLLSPSATNDWLRAADLWGRCLLLLPGSAFSALALLLHSRALREMGFAHIAADCLGLALAFGVNGLVVGTLTSPSPHAAASLPAAGAYLGIAAPATQVLRAACSLAILCFLLRSLRILEIQRRQELEVLAQQCSRAQQDTEEAHRHWLEASWSAYSKLAELLETILSTTRRYPGLAKTVDSALHKALDYTGLDAGMVYLLDEEGQALSLIAHHGLSPAFVQGTRAPELGAALLGRLISSKQPIVIEDPSDDPSGMTASIRDEGFTFLASIPLNYGGHPLGVMALAGKSHSPLGESDVVQYAAIGAQAGVAIENARLYQKVRHLAVLEERDRLAREMHDNLAQALGALQLQTSLVGEQLVHGQLDQAQATVCDLEDMISEAHTDVRETIFNMRAVVTQEAGFLPMLHEFLADYRRRYGVDVRLEAEGLDATIRLGPTAGQVVRIIQEALINVRKHAKASRVWVRLEQKAGQLAIRVQDNGQGFDPARVMGQDLRHVGLQVMHERAQSVGGTLTIVSDPGTGTEIMLQVPITTSGEWS